MRKFRTEWGAVVTIEELREEHWPIVLMEDELTPEEYPFEAYLHDCLSENGGALNEMEDDSNA